MSSIPRVSVLVPAWNDGSHLDAALASLAAQTWSDFEAVIADDGSTDETPAVAAAWSARDPRFRLLRSDVNRGMTENWNAALRAARGELVTKLDADDAAAPDFLAAMVPELDDPRVGAVFCRTVECDEALRPAASWDGERAFAQHGLDPAQRIVRGGHEWLAMSFDDHQLWHSNAFLMRRQELLALGGWDERWSCAADTDLILHVLEGGRPVVHVPVAGIHYRRRARSVSARAAADGWKAVEAVLVGLGSLSRAGRPLARRSRALRQSWWRLWRAAAALRRDRDLPARMPARQAEKLLPLLDAPPSPPAWVRIEGEVRLIAWRARHAGRPAAARPT
ncbi:MAG TPA: glycosyltransferase family 2 protein [Thermoanaerobaculia bacterium]|nr:glycosyltransferase family 2 protein [Thermoanaerobaculia bacterium]